MLKSHVTGVLKRSFSRHRHARKLRFSTPEMHTLFSAHSLAVPRYAYDDIFSRQVGQVAIRVFRLKLLTYSLSEDELLEWKIP